MVFLALRYADFRKNAPGLFRLAPMCLHRSFSILVCVAYRQPAGCR